MVVFNLNVFCVKIQKTYLSLLRDFKQKSGNKKLIFVKSMVLGGLLATSVNAKGLAEDYILISVRNMFGNTSSLQCEGNRRSAICTTASYDLKNYDITLKDFRYTVDYQDTRVIERFSGNLESLGMDETKKSFLPKHFECTDFTQIHSSMQQAGEQLVCMLHSDAYDLRFRLRAKAFSPLFKNQNAMSLMQKSFQVIDQATQQLNNTSRLGSDGDLNSFIHLLNKIDINLYGIDIVISKSKLPQKIYKLLSPVSSYYYDGNSQMAQAFYNAGVGYIYGNMMGYVWGNDQIDERTKEGLNNMLMSLRDFAMLGTDIQTIAIKITNRTKEGFNLGRAFKKISTKLSHARRLADRDNAGKIINSFNGEIFNRYRIEVETYRPRVSH